MNRNIIKSIIASLAVSLLGPNLVSAQIAQALQVTSLSRTTQNAGNDVEVAFSAKGFAADQTAVLWLLDRATHTAVQEIIAIDVPVREGENKVTFTLPFSWTYPGYFHVQLVVTLLNAEGQISKQVSSICPYTLRVRTAVIWPYGGTVINKSYERSWVTWATQDLIEAQYFKIYLHNETTGYLQLLADNVDPSLGRYLWTIPDVSGGNFRLLIQGFIPIEEDGSIFEDPAEITQSEKFFIQ